MTSKLASNERNRFPYDTFTWKGIDGSEVFAHCTNYLTGYNPDIENGDILEGVRKYAQKDLNDDILVPFGFADGGGGVTAEQIEFIVRTETLTDSTKKWQVKNTSPAGQAKSIMRTTVEPIPPWPALKSKTGRLNFYIPMHNGFGLCQTALFQVIFQKKCLIVG